MSGLSNREGPQPNRREFLKEASALTVGLMWGARELFAQEERETPTEPPVPCGVVGLGPQGRALLAALSRLPNAPVVGLCDTYEPFLKRSQEIAPNATLHTDYRALLSQAGLQAVFVATPSHLHREIALAALQAGKHVYCEAPLSSDLEECREMAQAAPAPPQIFQVGQQFRASPLHQHVRKFMEAQVLDKIVQVRAQWHKRESWRRAAPTPERERQVNWRLDPAVSAGLLGEVGLHQIDTVSHFLKQWPQAVSGFGSVLAWADGREVADTVQCVLEYPNGLRMVYEATLANSFDGAYELLLGTHGSILLRGQRGWLFKEADSPLLGWEVYAKKEQLGDETGIVLIANATKLIELGQEPSEAAALEEGKDELYYSVESFLTAIRTGEQPVCTALDGLRAAVVALKANEAVRTGTRIVYDPAWFEI